MRLDIDFFPSAQAILFCLVRVLCLQLQVVLILVRMIFFPFMSKMMDDVIATIGRTDYEIDSEHTLGPVSFTELEYDNVSLDEQVSSDEHYLFAGDELVAICVCFDKKVMTFDDALAHLTERFGEAEDVDLAVLGNGIYAVDDEGKLEGRALAVVYGDVMIVITEDEDEIEVTYVDPTAGFILAA